MTRKVREKKRIDESSISYYRLFTKGPAKENGVSEMVRIGTEKGTMVTKLAWQKVSGKEGGKVQEKGGKGEGRTCWTCGKAGHIAAWCRKGDNKNLFAIDEDSEHIEEAHDSEEDLQAWCLLEENENGKRWSANGKNKR